MYFVFIGHLALAGRVLWNRICPSFHPSFRPSFLPSVFHLSGRFLGIVLLIFSKFWHETRHEVAWSCVWQNRTFQKKKFCPKNWENGPKMVQKQSFLKILKNLVTDFHWMWMKNYIIGCVPAQIPYLGRFWFLRYGPKCSQPIRL